MFCKILSWKRERVVGLSYEIAIIASLSGFLHHSNAHVIHEVRGSRVRLKNEK